MERSSITLTVLFDAPFWVGIFERVENGRLTVAKVTFGAEPKDYEVHDFVLWHFYDLKFSPTVAAEEHHASDNPKRNKVPAWSLQYACSIFRMSKRVYFCGYRTSRIFSAESNARGE